MSYRVLVIGHQKELSDSYLGHNWLRELRDFRIYGCTSLSESVQIAGRHPFECIVLITCDRDPLLPRIIEGILKGQPQVPIIVLSRNVSAAEAADTMQAGAFKCLDLNDSPAAFRQLVRGILARETGQAAAGQSPSECEPWRKVLVGESPAMTSVVDTIRRIGPRRCTVLINGETGTGKELAARAVHMASPRAAERMVSVNCSALPHSLLEAELFGHTRGAFTGATGARVGLVEQANKGTLFLDEIGDMPVDLQAKLLRVLQEREFHRLGSSETVKVNVRVVAATNIDLEARIKQGKFREDLYYRLNVVPLTMPALRDRRCDIPALVSHFVLKICRNEEIPLKRLAPPALDELCRRDWPGNVRQLENAIEMAVAFSGPRDVLYPVDFGFGQRHAGVSAVPDALQPDLPVDTCFRTAVDRFGINILEEALAAAGGNKTRAAERLGMKRTTLIMKMRTLQQSGLLKAAGNSSGLVQQ
jgi:DNA-binding NtrC family response regulator